MLRVLADVGAPVPAARAFERRIHRHREPGALFRERFGRDGRRLVEPMAFAWYAGIRDDDLDAIVAYLRTLPPLAR